MISMSVPTKKLTGKDSSLEVPENVKEEMAKAKAKAADEKKRIKRSMPSKIKRVAQRLELLKRYYNDFPAHIDRKKLEGLPEEELPKKICEADPSDPEDAGLYKQKIEYERLIGLEEIKYKKILIEYEKTQA